MTESVHPNTNKEALLTDQTKVTLISYFTQYGSLAFYTQYGTVYHLHLNHNNLNLRGDDHDLKEGDYVCSKITRDELYERDPVCGLALDAFPGDAGMRARAKPAISCLGPEKFDELKKLADAHHRDMKKDIMCQPPGAPTEGIPLFKYPAEKAMSSISEENQIEDIDDDEDDDDDYESHSDRQQNQKAVHRDDDWNKDLIQNKSAYIDLTGDGDSDDGDKGANQSEFHDLMEMDNANIPMVIGRQRLSPHLEVKNRQRTKKNRLTGKKRKKRPGESDGDCQTKKNGTNQNLY